MAGYWPSSFFASLWTETLEAPAILTKQAWSIMRILFKNEFKKSVYILVDRTSLFLQFKCVTSKLKIMIHQLETIIAKSNNKLKAHNMKWGKYKNNWIYIESRVVAALC